jgi:hypothetical protein
MYKIASTCLVFGYENQKNNDLANLTHLWSLSALYNPKGLYGYVCACKSFAVQKLRYTRKGLQAHLRFCKHRDAKAKLLQATDREILTDCITGIYQKPRCAKASVYRVLAKPTVLQACKRVCISLYTSQLGIAKLRFAKSTIP